MIYDRIRTMICKKSIIYGRHRRRSCRFFSMGAKKRRGPGHTLRPIRHAAPRHAATVRARPYTRRIRDPNLSGTPAATCHLHVLAWPGPRRLGKYFKTSRDTVLSLSPPLLLPLSLSLSTDNSSRCAPASSTSLIRLRILRVATIFSRTCFDLVVVYGNKISFRRVTVVNFVL